MLGALSIMAFCVIHAMPVDPAEQTLLELNIPVTEENISALNAKWGLDRSIGEQYIRWLCRFLTGDWGNSFVSENPVFDEFSARLPYSLVIGLGGFGLSIVLCIPFGLFAAFYPAGLADRLSRALTVGTQAMPAFCLGLILIWTVSVKLELMKPFTGAPWQRLLLPTLLVTLYSVGSLTRVFRRELQQAQNEPYFRTALAKGLTRNRAIITHAGRPALFGLLAAITPECAWIVGGTSVVEVVFAVPGVSHFLVESIAQRDYLVLQAYIMVIGIWMLIVHTLASYVRKLLDPRVT
jgi:peptide/nickel transport system permease protein